MNKYLYPTSTRSGALDMATAVAGDGRGRLFTGLDPITGQLQGWQHQKNQEAPVEEWTQPHPVGGALVRQNALGTVTYKGTTPTGLGFTILPGALPPVTAALRAT